MKTLFIGFVAALALVSISESASAGSRAPAIPAHTMTCDQAIAFYQKYRRIYVIAHGKDLVPIYGMKPIAEWPSLVCTGRGQAQVGYSVKTRDTNRCYVAVKCQ